jgi:hypothetical protein
MKLRNALAVPAAVLLALGGTFAIAGAPAQAACSPGSGYVAGYPSASNCDYVWIRQGNSISVGHCDSMGPSNTGYVRNHSSQLYWAWTGTGCSGTHGPLYANTDGPMGGVFYNHVYSIQRKS